MPNEILVITATLAARTPAAPLMPQNQGVGRRSTFETKMHPCRKAKSHEEAGRRQHQNCQSGSDQEVCALKVKEELREAMPGG